MTTFIKEHLGFILTMTVTYVLGILLIVVQYVALNNNISEIPTDIMKLLLDSLIPTTITYVLGCVLVNIVDLLKSKADNYVFNLFTCIFVILYAIIFCIYMMTGFSKGWIVGELVITLLLLVLNIMCYKERFKSRIHNLV